jgi:hypothetical protein
MVLLIDGVGYLNTDLEGMLESVSTLLEFVGLEDFCSWKEF